MIDRYCTSKISTGILTKQNAPSHSWRREYEECRQAVYSLRHTGYPVIDKMPFQNDRPPLPFYRSGASGKNRVQIDSKIDLLKQLKR